MNLKFIFSIISSLLIITSSFAQFSAPELGELFRDDIVPRIDITIPADSLEWLLDDNNLESNELLNAAFIFNNGTVLDTLENVGFRLRGNTSRNANKKSFKIDFNRFVSGRKYHGVEKVNLNGQHNDPTSSRAKICSDLARKMNIPSLRSNHVEFYINGAYFGLYTNVEHIDEEYIQKRFGNNNGNLYKCLYPADLDYKGSNPDLYKEEFWGRRAYDLKNNLAEENYSDLAHFIDILNNTPSSQLVCALEPVFNVDQYLKFIVFDILTGNWDGPIYNKNNFYLYHNESTGQFEYIPFDLDNTLGIDWVDRDWGNRNIYSWSQSNNPRPIYTKIMDIQEYKDRFSFYMNEAINEFYNETYLFPYLDNIKNNLSSFISTDTFYNKDYGFTTNDFNDGFEMELPFSQTDYGLKSFITTRKNAAESQLIINDISPIITQVNNNYPNENEDILIQAYIIDDQNINQVEVCYSLLASNYVCYDMFDDGMHNDEAADDGIYGAIIPALNQAATFEYNIFATDNSSQQSMYPACLSRYIHIENSDLSLAINEFMADNNSSIADENGEFDDWLEIHNYGSDIIYLGDKYLSDNINNPNKWAMPNITINPNEYLIFWADNDEEQGNNHTNFKLSSAGEFIGIFNDENSGFSLIDGLDFGIQDTDISWGRIPNGTGDFQSLSPSPGEPNIITGINNPDLINLDILISPNPVSDILYFSINNHEIKYLDLNIEIHNVLGEIIYNKMIQSDEFNIPIHHISSGIYFISIKDENKLIASQKFIKR